MMEERMSYDADKLDEEILLERHRELDKIISYEILGELEYIYNEGLVMECPYCGSAIEFSYSGYVSCISCGTYIEKF